MKDVIERSISMRSAALLQELKLVENEMLFKLSIGRTRYKHSGGKGSVVEYVVRQFLRDYLRLDVGTGEIIDTSANKSAQTDAVIVGSTHPLTFQQDEHSLFLIEGVMAVGEVKSVLTTSLMKGTNTEEGVLSKSRRFKELTVKHTSGETGAMSLPLSDIHLPYYVHRPYFLFAFASKLSLPGICKLIMNYEMEMKAVGEFRIIDAVFILNEKNKGWVINFDGLGPIEHRQVDQMKGWKWQSSETVLADMLSWLSIVMPRHQSQAALFYWYSEPW